ncbi:MAG: Sir2 family NAD-dependent protein deacetylase [Hyphomicrobiaceae bacterium]|nr:Sir2 family NAD-dependent protein deacetylase [Hyphomicrobiaceae bacterium]
MAVVTCVNEGRALLARLFGEARNAVVLTGAGVSTESGIPDYRSPGGIWARFTPIEFADFVRSEASRLEDWRRRFVMKRDFDRAEPNVTHRALARLTRTGAIALLITQNIDGLHGRAGTAPERLLEIHGNGTHGSCLGCGLRAELVDLEAEIADTGIAPHCRACGGLVKAAVVSFGQAMPADALARCERAVQSCDLFVAIGSSLQVYPAAGLPLLARAAGAELVIVNGEPTGLDSRADHVLRGSVGEFFAGLD